eukprot:765215-Hanusia_phi.AAC.2
MNYNQLHHQNKKNSLLKRMPGHNIALSKEWVSHENKYHMSNGMLNSGNKKQLGRALSHDLHMSESRAPVSVPYMVALDSIPNESTYSVCITKGSGLKSSVRVTGSIKNSTVPASGLYCKSILDRFGESGVDLRSATDGIAGFHECWEAVKESCNDKNKILAHNQVAAEQVLTLGEDKHVKQVVIHTNSYMVGQDDLSFGSVQVKKLNVFVGNNLVHETVFFQHRQESPGSPAANYTITTNVVKGNTSEVMVDTQNKELARVLSNGDMVRSSILVGLPFHLQSYNVINYNSDGYSTLASDLKLNCKAGRGEQLETCLQELKGDIDNMTNMRVILDNALTKAFLIQGDEHDLFKLDSVVVLP